jgi:hypothetical protein
MANPKAPSAKPTPPASRIGTNHGNRAACDLHAGQDDEQRAAKDDGGERQHAPAFLAHLAQVPAHPKEGEHDEPVPDGDRDMGELPALRVGSRRRGDRGLIGGR